MKQFDYDSYPGNYQYNALESKFSLQRFWHKGKLTLIDNLVDIQKKDVILDIGCGSGNLCFHISNKCDAVFGIDPKKDAIKFANKMKQEKKENTLTFLVQEGQSLQFPDKFFNKIFLLDVLEHVENPTHLLNEAHRVLKDDGIIILTTPNYRSFWPILEFTADHLHITPENADQHITKFTVKKMKELLQISSFSLKKIGSIYCLSPYFSFSSFANTLLDFEIKQRLIGGMLLYSIAEKGAVKSHARSLS